MSMRLTRYLRMRYGFLILNRWGRPVSTVAATLQKCGDESPKQASRRAKRQ